jgi:hypothetical protein
MLLCGSTAACRTFSIAAACRRLNFLSYERTQGLNGFLAELFEGLRGEARDLGFVSAGALERQCGYQAAIIELLRKLPADRVHFMVVSMVMS